MRRSAAAVATLALCLSIWLFGRQTAGRALLAFGFPSAAALVLENAAWRGAAFAAAGRWSEAAGAFAADAASAYNLGNALARAGRYEEAIAAFDRALAANPLDEDAAFNKALLTTALLEQARPSGAGAGAISPNSAASKAGGSRERPEPGGETRGAGDGLASGKESASGQSATGGSKASKDGAGESAATDDGRAKATGPAGASDGAGRSGGAQVDVAALLHERERRVRRRLQAGSVQPSREWLETLPDDPGRFLKLRILAEKARRLRAAGGPLQDDD